MRNRVRMLTAETSPRSASAESRRPVAVLVVAAMVIGGLSAAGAPAAAETLASFVDPIIIALLVLLLVDLQLPSMSRRERPSPRPIARTCGAPIGTVRLAALVLGVNFLITPLVALALAAALPAESGVRLGVLLFCLFPCTDWFLGFTRTAGGDVRTGAVLIPISLALQLTLFPVYLTVLASWLVTTDASASPGDPLLAIAEWFLLPLALAAIARALLRIAVAPEARASIRSRVGQSIPFVIAALIACLFAGNIATVQTQWVLLGIVAVVVAAFFLVMGAIGEALSRGLGLDRGQRSLLLIATSARNAPLVLALTAVAVPGEPLVLTVIVIGMLVELTHLTALSTWLDRRRGAPAPSAPVVSPTGAPR
nr:bile acid:sodium symporter [Microcella alkalica]